jgi:ankyrin repeat protein
MWINEFFLNILSLIFYHDAQGALRMKNSLLFIVICCAATQVAHAAMDLHEAVMNGDIKKVQILLSAGADIGRKGACGRIPLHFAVICGCHKVVQMLLSAGTSVNQKDDSGCTPLHLTTMVAAWILLPFGINVKQQVAAMDLYQMMVKILLLAGADSNLPDTDGCTPLHDAALLGHQVIVRMLLSAGANPDLRDSKYGCTPLHWAAKNGHKAVVRALLSAGAQAHVCDKRRRMPLHLAAKRGHKVVVQMLKNYMARKEVDVLLQASHVRVGSNSEARILRYNEYKKIFELLRYTDR